MIEGVFRDLIHAARRLRATPTFTLVAVTSLALGLGVNAVAFSLLSAVSLRPLPFAHPERLVDVYEHHPVEVCPGCGVGTSWQNFLDWRDGNGAFAAMAAYRPQGLVWRTADGPQRIRGLATTPGLFDLLGARFVAGRAFTSAEDAPGGPAVAVVREGFWRERLGGRSDVVGSVLSLDGVQHIVVGVVADGLDFPSTEDAWVPLAPRAAGEARDDRSVSVVARLASARELPDAAAEMAAMGTRLAEAHPLEDGGWSTHVRALHADLAADYAPSFMAFLGAVLFVLLVACANLAGLFLVRGADRGRELAVRASLGASRAALVQSLLAEAAVIGVGGGALGFLAAWWGIDLVRALLGANLPGWVRVALDGRVLAFTTAATLLTVVAFGLLPALRSSREGLAAALRSGSGGSGGPGPSRIRRVLVVAEAASALVLLTGTGLLLRRAVEASRVDLGYDPAPLLTADVQLFGDGEGRSAEGALQRALVEGAAGVPGVAAAALSNVYVVDWPGGAERGAEAEGTGPGIAEATLRRGVLVSPRYFETLGIPLVSGRVFTAQDDEGAPVVAILSAAAAEALWPGEDPLGRRVRVGTSDPDSPWRTVVGVVADVQLSPMARAVSPLLYIPYLQHPTTSPQGVPPSVHVRAASGSPARLVVPVRSALVRAAPDVVVSTVDTDVQRLRAWIWPLWLTTRLAAALSLFAGALALSGVYGVIAYAVRSRRRELGIRVVLGADRRRILRGVLDQGIRLAGAGTAVGIVAAALLTPAMGSVVVDLGRLDPLVLAVAVAAFGGVTVLASYLPARDAARTDPVEALRED